MKTINVSDAGYKILMTLSKELQLQPNHGQAFPYYWEPRSDRRDYDLNGEGEFKIVVLDYEENDPSELASNNPELFGEFLSENVDEDVFLEASDLGDDLVESYKEEWTAWLCDNKGYDLYTYNMEPKSEHNPSLFFDDAKGYIEHNQHHLGPNAHAYGQTVQRMPMMDELVKAIYRLNPQPKEDVCDEAWRVVQGQDEGRGWFRGWAKAKVAKMESSKKPTILGIIMYGLGGWIAGFIVSGLYLWCKS